MNTLSVVVPSKNEANLRQCIQSLRQHEPDVQVVVVDDFPEGKRPANLDHVQWCAGVKPFVFARNVNLGIQMCDGDVVLLNDDAQLKTPQGLSKMQQALEENKNFGLLGSSRLPNPRHHLYQRTLNNPVNAVGETPLMVPFFCALIPRRTIEAAGLLDERFVGYGYDDDDYCLRVRRAGMQIGVFLGCYVDHASLPSSYRTGIDHRPQMALNRKLFCEKWGSHPL